MADVNDELTVRVKSIAAADGSGFRRVAMDLEPGTDPRVESMLFLVRIADVLWQQSCLDLKPEDFCVVELGPYGAGGPQEVRSIRRIDGRELQASGKGVH